MGLIRENLLWTEVPYGAECHSACVIAFVGGVERQAVGVLGVHPFYSEDILGSGDCADASELYDQVSDLLEAYLKEMRIPLALLDGASPQRKRMVGEAVADSLFAGSCPRRVGARRTQSCGCQRATPLPGSQCSTVSG